MNKLKEIRDALQKYAADEAECHVRGMTHIPKTACDALATLDALMETHAIVAKEIVNLWNNTTDQQDVKVELDLDNARELFENWLTGNGDYPHLIHKSFGGQYIREEAAMKWDGFKAAYYAISRAEHEQTEETL